MAFDLDLFPTTLTYIANLSSNDSIATNLSKAKVNFHAKDEGFRSNHSTGRVQTNEQTDATKCIISLALQLIKIDERQNNPRGPKICMLRMSRKKCPGGCEKYAEGKKRSSSLMNLMKYDEAYENALFAFI